MAGTKEGRCEGGTERVEIERGGNRKKKNTFYRNVEMSKKKKEREKNSGHLDSCRFPSLRSRPSIFLSLSVNLFSAGLNQSRCMPAALEHPQKHPEKVKEEKEEEEVATATLDAAVFKKTD